MSEQAVDNSEQERTTAGAMRWFHGRMDSACAERGIPQVYESASRLTVSAADGTTALIEWKVADSFGINIRYASGEPNSFEIVGFDEDGDRTQFSEALLGEFFDLIERPDNIIGGEVTLKF